MAFEPPFEVTYKTLLKNCSSKNVNDMITAANKLLLGDVVHEECELPLIDLSQLKLGPLERDKCAKAMAKAASEWGFFQVENHGISEEVMERMLEEEAKLFRRPFQRKVGNQVLTPNSYNWGNPNATTLRQLHWSESFHLPLADLENFLEDNYLRTTIEKYAKDVAFVAETVAETLGQTLGIDNIPRFLKQNFPPSSSCLRMNRYPPCQFSSQLFGFLPHTDSCFLTIVLQDQIGGLQIMKDGRWFSVRPASNTLVINIGDLFQAWSNDKYKSVKHRIIAPEKVERMSLAYFYCPLNDTVIKSLVYRSFTLEEYRKQVKKDLRDKGDKVGLSRFLLHVG